MDPAAIVNPMDWGFQAATAWGATAHGWPESAASIVISSLWQGAVVASGLAICLRLAPNLPSRLRYGMWASGFAALVCLPFLPALIERLAPSGFSATPAHSFTLAAGTGISPESSAHLLLALDARWSLGLAALWLAASVLRATSLAAHALRMRHLWRSAMPVDGAAHGGALVESAGVRRAAPAEIWATSDLDRPCVIGFFRPRILIPAWLLNRLTPAELEQVVLHESEHLRRRDDWANLIQKLCLVLFPLNPALWWLERHLCAEREIACDDGVVSRTHAPRAYAACLAGLAERGLEHRSTLRLRDALSLGAWQRRPELAARVHRLLRRPAALSPVASWASVALVGCGLVAGTIALARSPQVVAFVAPANQASHEVIASSTVAGAQPGLADADLVLGPAAFAEPSAQPYRAVKALAIMPAARASSLPRTGNETLPTGATGTSVRPRTTSSVDMARPTDDSSRPNHSLAALVPAAVAARMKAQQVSQSAEPPAHQSDATPTGWLLLTTFEEVQTAGSGEEVQGDAVVGESSTHSTGSGPNASTSISVTRLVLRFVLPTANDSPASQAQPASNTPQRIAIPYRDGWFVIQL
jgi:Zn-dependent protease with chaperone function